MPKRYNLREANQIKEQGVFFDANVLIYLFWPTGQYHYEANYASAYATLRRQKTALFVDFLVVSEVINRVLRFEYGKCESSIAYKMFRNSPEGLSAAEDIFAIVKDSILDKFYVIGQTFGKQDIAQFLIADELDLMDKAILAICENHNFVLFTNDQDFKDSQVDILSGNPKILG